jgi:ribulose-phosphate 3-epimerase
MKSMKIIPAILATTEDDYQKSLKRVKESGLFDWVQIDLMDNKFVQNKSIDPSIIAKYPVNLKLEAHLMVEYPENWIDELIKSEVDRIIFPIEDREGIKERITHIKNHRIEVGLSINPETFIGFLEPYLEMVDVILVMSVHPGFQGQEFITETKERIFEINELRRKNNSKFKIEVDGGISEDNIRKVSEAGADIAVVGSNLLKYDNLEEGLNNLQKAF